MLVAYTLGVAIVVGAIISLATDSWWFLIVALGAHLIGSAFFLAYTFKRLEQGDKPDPVTEARLEAEGNGNGGGKADDGLTDSGRRADREIVN
jgi:hypothetical protein